MLVEFGSKELVHGLVDTVERVSQQVRRTFSAPRAVFAENMRVDWENDQNMKMVFSRVALGVVDSS